MTPLIHGLERFLTHIAYEMVMQEAVEVASHCLASIFMGTGIGSVARRKHIQPGLIGE